MTKPLPPSDAEVEAAAWDERMAAEGLPVRAPVATGADHRPRVEECYDRAAMDGKAKAQ